ncbi:FHA domain-containing protein [Planctomycetota bacterium]
MNVITMIVKIIREENKPEREFTVDKFPVTIGRTRDNTIRIASPFLSREHCRIEETKKGFRVKDMDSKNGLSVNGQAVKTSDLSSGDIITIGNNTFTLLVDNAKEKYQKSNAPSMGQPNTKTFVSSIDEQTWKAQLEEEEITECTHCGVIYSIAYDIPGVGPFCPKCKTKAE